jgi:hypothetical protein
MFLGFIKHKNLLTTNIFHVEKFCHTQKWQIFDMTHRLYGNPNYTLFNLYNEPVPF